MKVRKSDGIAEGLMVGTATLVFVFGMASVVNIACSPGVTKAVVKSVIDVALAACIAENPGADEKELKAACQYADELAPAVKDLMAAQKKGAVKVAAAKCPEPAKDGGK